MSNYSGEFCVKKTSNTSQSSFLRQDWSSTLQAEYNSSAWIGTGLALVNGHVAAMDRHHR